MNEQLARDVVLVRAIESADRERAIFTNEDRTHASRAAAELARWHAAEHKQASSAERFIGQRAELLAKTLARRAPALARAARAFQWRSWIDVVLPAAAFAFGALVEHIADRQHVNVLAFPLLAIIVWNVIVYVLLLLRPLLRTGRIQFDLGGPRRWLTALGQRSLPRQDKRGPAAESISAFVAQWTPLVAPLMAARAARVLHLAAALLALGAIAGLYVRGLIFEYRAGWESTFLDAPAVHAILSFILGPAAQSIGAPFPTVDQIAAMRFGGSTPGAGGTNAALWIHLYAVTVGAVVIVPRLLLASLATWQQRRRARSFKFDLSEPYFRRLGSFVGGVARMRVVPYSYTPDEAVQQGLRAAARTLLGDDADVSLLPAVAFGAEDQLNPAALAADSPVALTLALFSLAATPENENHGAFLKTLRQALAPASTARLAVLVDESGYRRRLGTQAGADQRLAERRDTWRYFCQSLGIDLALVDLSAPDPVAIERALEPVLAAQPL